MSPFETSEDVNRYVKPGVVEDDCSCCPKACKKRCCGDQEKLNPVLKWILKNLPLLISISIVVAVVRAYMRPQLCVCLVLSTVFRD